jgi:hypothetical protein
MKIYKLSPKIFLEKHSRRNRPAIISYPHMQILFHVTVEKLPYGEKLGETG